MLEWLERALSCLPQSYANILLYTTLTGLRAEEAIASIGLMKSDLDQYRNNDSNILEHFRYPKIFIRKTKKAYVSIMTEETLVIAKNSGGYSYSAIYKKLRNSHIPIRMKYCRKIFFTYLRMNGIESELIDLLQGRIPKTVFARHYFRPDFEKDMLRIRNVLEKLKGEISAV